MVNDSQLLVLHGVWARCADCGDGRAFLPVDAGDLSGEYCCTSCDGAVFLSLVVHRGGGPADRHVA